MSKNGWLKRGAVTLLVLLGIVFLNLAVWPSGRDAVPFPKGNASRLKGTSEDLLSLPKVLEVTGLSDPHEDGTCIINGPFGHEVNESGCEIWNTIKATKLNNYDRDTGYNVTLPEGLERYKDREIELLGVALMVHGGLDLETGTVSGFVLAPFSNTNICCGGAAPNFKNPERMVYVDCKDRPWTSTDQLWAIVKSRGIFRVGQENPLDTVYRFDSSQVTIISTSLDELKRRIDQTVENFCRATPDSPP